MQEIIDLSKAGHAKTAQIKQLHLESQNGYPDLDNYLRIGYNNIRHIDYIDFDGGPFLAIGSKVGDYIITDFIHDGNFKNIKVIVDDNIYN